MAINRKAIKKYLTKDIFNSEWFEMFDPENEEMGAEEFEITEDKSSLSIEYIDGDGMVCIIEVKDNTVYIQECVYEECNLLQWLNDEDRKDEVISVLKDLLNMGVEDIQYQFVDDEDTDDYISILDMIK